MVKSAGRYPRDLRMPPPRVEGHGACLSPLKSHSCLTIQQGDGRKSVALLWRREWDLNPRTIHHRHTISNRARSTAPPSLQAFLLYMILPKNAIVFWGAGIGNALPTPLIPLLGRGHANGRSMCFFRTFLGTSKKILQNLWHCGILKVRHNFIKFPQSATLAFSVSFFPIVEKL